MRYGKNMSKEFRNVIIKAAREYRGSIRQLSRLTGLSYGLIRKVS
jgi:enhancing lycopene biosynthesis protein 2